jgi:hypothetical protein
MKKFFLSGLITATCLSVMFLGGGSRAFACGKGSATSPLFTLSELASVAAVVTGVADVGMLGADLVFAAGPRAPRWYGWVELGVATPQALLLYGALINDTGTGVNGRAPLAILSAWTTAMAIHGAYLVWTQPSQPRQPRREDDDIDHRRGPRSPSDPDRPHAVARPGPQWDLAPAAFAARDQTTAMPGAMLFGRF